MTCQDYKNLMMGYLDDELNAQQRKTFEEHLASCAECTAEFEEFGQLKQITDDAALAEPEEVLWKQYWGGIYNRIERGAGSSTDIDLLVDIASKLEGQTICAFADAAAWPVQGVLRHFWHEFEYYVEHGHSMVDDQKGKAA